ncbi:MAG: hypothetical protein AAFN93_16125 [Bacteroidota bacterium]
MNLNKIVLGSVLILFSFTSVSAQEYDLKTAVGYMQAVGAKYRDITKANWEYTKAVGHGKRDKKIEKRRVALLAQIAEARRQVRRLPAFEGDSKLRDSTVNYLNVSYHVTNDDYAKIINLEEVAERSYDDMEAFLLAQEMVGKKMATAAENLDVQQELFATQNDINLVESNTKLGRKMKQANKTMKYSNEVYLVFFKSYKQESYLLDALKSGDLTAMEQNKDALTKYSAEGREKLKSMSSFDGDQSLYIACRQLLQFYSEEAENKIPVMMEYYLEAEKFDKIQKAFENIKQSKRTQANIDQYNEGVRALNAASERFNAVNGELNKKRSKLIENWNKKRAQFLNKHTP